MFSFAVPVAKAPTGFPFGAAWRFGGRAVPAMSTLFSGLDGMLFRCRVDERRTLFVSPRVEEVLGYPRNEWLEQPDIWTELLHPDDRETELAAHDRHTETGEPWKREYRLIASDGRVVWVRDQAKLVRDEDGERR